MCKNKSRGREIDSAIIDKLVDPNYSLSTKDGILFRCVKFIKESGRRFNKNNDQFWTGLNNDKKGLNSLIDKENENENKSSEVLINEYSGARELSAKSYFINFQYLLEFIIRFQKQLGLTDQEVLFFEDGFEDLFIALRLSLQGHYRTSYIHIRSFLEKNISIIYSYCKRNKYFDGVSFDEQGDYARAIELLKKIGEGESGNFKCLFDVGEYNKLYSYASKHAHSSKKYSNSSYNIDFSEDELVYQMETIGIAMFMVGGMFYTFMGDKIKEHWLINILKTIPWERNHYRYVIGDLLIGSDIMIFNTINTKKLNTFFTEQIKLDASKFDVSK